jgi:hypothetical protein
MSMSIGRNRNQKHLRSAHRPRKARIVKGTIEREAINLILRKVEASAVLAQQHHVAAMVEAIRQSYNHRDYLYDVLKEISSSKSTAQKSSNISDRTVEEIKAEVVGRLVSGGVSAVSSRLGEMGAFARLGAGGAMLNEGQSILLQTFFEGTLNQIREGTMTVE